MARSAPPVDDEVHAPHDLRPASRRLWWATWVVFAVVLVVGVGEYLVLFQVVPMVLWIPVGGGLALAAAALAVNVDVVDARRKRGPRFGDLVARVVAFLLVVLLWLVPWGTLLVRGCPDQEGCESVPVVVPLLATVPLVPLLGLTLVGSVVRRAADRDA